MSLARYLNLIGYRADFHHDVDRGPLLRSERDLIEYPLAKTLVLGCDGAGVSGAASVLGLLADVTRLGMML